MQQDFRINNFITVNNARGAGVIITRIQQGHMIHQTQIPCNICHGQRFDSQAANLHCSKCLGQQTIKIKEEVETEIPLNILKNPTTLLKGKGPWHDGEYIDLLVYFKLYFSENYDLQNNKLTYNMHITLADSICGFRKIIKHPSQKNILIESEPGYVINPYCNYSLPRLGLFNGHYNDSMCLSLVIDYPDQISIPTNQIVTFNVLE